MGWYAIRAKALVLGSVAGSSVGDGDTDEGAGNLAVHLGGFDSYAGAGASARSLVGAVAGFNKHRWDSWDVLVVGAAQERGDEGGNNGVVGLAGWSSFDIEFAGGRND